MTTPLASANDRQPHAGRWLQRVRRRLARVADLIAPPVCLACRSPLADHHALCAPCWRGITFIRAPLCDRLGWPMPYDTGETIVSAAALAAPPDYDRARAVAGFSGVMRDLVHGLKYGDSQDARTLFGRWLSQAGAELLADADLLVPIPLHRWRLIRRRYNQAAVLAKEVSRVSGVTFAPLLLERVRATPSQVGLTEAERRDNVAGAFVVPKARRVRLKGRRVVIVDDVITTGATVNAAARVLRRAGAARVDVLALALVTDDDRIRL